MRNYGKLLKEYRNKHGLSQNELAKMLGVTQPFISQLEQERVEIFAESLREKVEELLGIKGQTAEQLLEKIVESVEKKEAASRPKVEVVEEKEDMIHSPKHYKISGCNFESIDLVFAFIEDLRGKLSGVVFNIVKYLVRAEKKDGRRDYEKCRKYLTWAIPLGENESGKYLDDIAESLNTDWFTIISGICEGMPLKKALLVNEIFRLVAEADYEEAMKYLDKILEA